MPVELEEIALFGFYKLNNRTILIQEKDLANITTLSSELTPIPIDSQKLQRLGFLRHPNGIYYRQQGDIEFLLRPLKNGQWEFSIDGNNRIRILAYIHQLQRLWFALFDDHLFIPQQESNSKKNEGRAGGLKSLAQKDERPGERVSIIFLILRK